MRAPTTSATAAAAAAGDEGGDVGGGGAVARPAAAPAAGTLASAKVASSLSTSAAAVLPHCDASRQHALVEDVGGLVDDRAVGGDVVMPVMLSVLFKTRSWSTCLSLCVGWGRVLTIGAPREGEEVWGADGPRFPPVCAPPVLAVGSPLVNAHPPHLRAPPFPHSDAFPLQATVDGVVGRVDDLPVGGDVLVPALRSALCGDDGPASLSFALPHRGRLLPPRPCTRPTFRRCPTAPTATRPDCTKMWRAPAAPWPLGRWAATCRYPWYCRFYSRGVFEVGASVQVVARRGGVGAGAPLGRGVTVRLVCAQMEGWRSGGDSGNGVTVDVEGLGDCGGGEEFDGSGVWEEDE